MRGEPDERPERLAPLTMRRPSELLGMAFDDSDLILGDRLLAEGQPMTLLGAGGLGKSRLLLQLACAQIAGRDFVGIPTHGRPRRWMIFQTENNNRRLREDFSRLRIWAGEEAWESINENLQIHTLESADDGSLCFEERANEIGEQLEKHGADVAVFDPLKDFTFKDLNGDADMQAVTATMRRIVNRGNPKRAIIVLHHARTGKAAAQQANGVDRSSFGRNSKVLFNWTRAQINLAPGGSESNETLLVSCGKNSNGREFERFAITLNANGIYERAKDFQFGAWDAHLAGNDQQQKRSPDFVRKLVGEAGSEKKRLASAIQEETGCGHTAAYAAISKAETAGRIRFSKTTKLYKRA